MTIVMRGLGISPILAADPAFVPAVVSAEELVPMAVGAVELIPTPHDVDVTVQVEPGFGPGCLKFDGPGMITYTGTALALLLDKGCIRMRWRPDYDGQPTTAQVLWSSEGGAGWFSNAIAFGHLDAGQGGSLIAYILDVNSDMIVMLMGSPYNATSGDWVDVEFGYDVTVGSGWGGELWVGGQLYGSAPGTGTRTATDAYGLGSNESLFYAADEIIVFDQAQHRSPFTPSTTPLIPPYASDVLLAGHFNDVAGQSFDWDYVRDGDTPGQDITGSPEIESISDPVDPDLIPEAMSAKQLVPDAHGAQELVPTPYSSERVT